MVQTVFQVLPFVFALMLMGVFVRTARLKVRAQAIWAMVFLVCAAKFVAFAALGGHAFNPELPEKVIWVWNWAYSGMCLLLAVALPWASVAFCARRTTWVARWRRGGLFVLPMLAWLLSAVGLHNGIKVPTVVERSLVCADLPAELDGYRILHLTDIHVSAAACAWRTEAIVARANAAQADLMVCTGDIVDGLVRDQQGNVRPLRNLTARDGVWFVTGNHEFYSDGDAWRSQYARWGFRFLRNEWVSPRQGLVVAGVDDPVGYARRLAAPEAAAPSVNAAFANAPTNAFRVLLQHRPFVDYAALGAAPTARVDLQLSGHTHGGIAPILSGLVRACNHGFVRGFYDLPQGGRLYVSPGAGQWAGFPVRFANPPEITVLTLRRK